MPTKWWNKKNSGCKFCTKCESYNFIDRATCFKCNEALPPSPGAAAPGPGKKRRPGAGSRRASGPPEACSPEYALECIRNTFGQAAAEGLQAVAEATKPQKEKEPENIGQMQAAADAARRAFGDEGAAHLDKMVEEARRKKQEAKKPHLRVRDAEVKLVTAKKAFEAARADLERMQELLAKAVKSFQGAEARVTTAQAELQEVKATVYKDEAGGGEHEAAKAKAAHEALALLRGAQLSPEAAQALAAVEAGLPPVPPTPPPPESVAQPSREPASEQPQEDEQMPAFDELPPERVQFLTRKWGEGEGAAEKAKEAWDSMLQVAEEQAKAKRQRLEK